MTMGERIHERRKARDLTLEYVGNFVGVAKSTVRKWENGDIENISALRLQKLAVVLGTTVDYLMDGVTSNLLYKNVEAMPDVRPVPVIGKIACGEPILAKQNIEGYAELDRRVRADFSAHRYFQRFRAGPHHGYPDRCGCLGKMGVSGTGA